jgi:hypothetical protein
MTGDARRRLAKQMAEVARGAKLMREHPAFEPMRKWQEQMRSLIAEGEEAYTSETTSTAPASETTTPATPMPAPQSEARQASAAEAPTTTPTPSATTTDDDDYGAWLEIRPASEIAIRNEIVAV